MTLRTVAYQAPLPMGFSRQEYWSGLPFLPPGDLTDPGIEPTFPVAPALQVDSLLLNHWEAQVPSPDNVKNILKKGKMSFLQRELTTFLSWLPFYPVCFFDFYP